MDLPSFLWLWKIAAWSMGFSLVTYMLLAITGIWMRGDRRERRYQLWWLRPIHYLIGKVMVGLVLLLLAIGIVGTLGHYGSLGHSGHLLAGAMVVGVVLLSAWSATQISRQRPWARPLHISLNAVLFIGFAWVSWSGWIVVQKYLP